MLSKILLCISGLFVTSAFADTTLAFESIPMRSESQSFSESQPLAYKPELDPHYNCSSWGWWCDIKFGLKNAESRGVNGVMINGYAYLLSVGLHWPTGYNKEAKLNEFTPGVGYTRTFYNPQYNTEYILYATAFVDSYYKPEVNIGYGYQKYFDITDSGSLKWGIGYTPFIFVKPSMTDEAPIPIPALGIMSSFKYHNVALMFTYFNVVFVNVRVDL